VAGTTASTDFDTVDPIETDDGFDDAFVSKLTAAGDALAYSTYLGGNDDDIAGAIALDPVGQAYIAGETDSTDFDSVNPVEGDGTTTDTFVAKISDARCAGKPPTLTGTVGPDQLVGTGGRDVIVAFDGEDTISGLAGNDVACGGDGDDRLKGGEGNDKLFGQRGKDTHRGGPGKETCSA
jgi:Ca2+-binding RTX toxin-like protein